MLSVERPEDLLTMAGTDLGTSPWKTVGQDRIDLFAVATDDHQWIHVDPDRAAASVFGGTIAHGFLSLSLVSSFLGDLLKIRNAEMLVNYGLDRVRFPTAVLAGSSVRASGQLVEASQRGSRVQLRLEIAVELAGCDKPACFASFLLLVA